MDMPITLFGLSLWIANLFYGKFAMMGKYLGCVPRTVVSAGSMVDFVFIWALSIPLCFFNLTVLVTRLYFVCVEAGKNDFLGIWRRRKDNWPLYPVESMWAEQQCFELVHLSRVLSLPGNGEIVQRADGHGHWPFPVFLGFGGVRVQ